MTQPTPPSGSTTTPATTPTASTGIRPAAPAPSTSASQGEEDWVKAAREAGAPLAAFRPAEEDADARDEMRSRVNDPEAQQEVDESNYIYVESGRDDDRAVLYERDSMHPGGEVFVGPGEVVQVAKTASVLARLDNGDLVEADKGKWDEQQKAQEEAAAKEAQRMEARDRILSAI